MNDTDQKKIDDSALACAKKWGFNESIIANLETAKIDSFFPIQQLVIPALLHQYESKDVCVSAPTGSGKTLVYLLPIIQKLSPRVIRRLRALIVVPSRDLAIQVKSVCDQYCAGSTLTCGLAIGQMNFAKEQKHLVGQSGSKIDHLLGLHQNENDDFLSLLSGSSTSSRPLPRGGQSQVDILVATPGRLVDHLEQTPGFTLQHLQFLVVDEADRLLNQPYHDWISKIDADIFSPEALDTHLYPQEEEAQPITKRQRLEQVSREIHQVKCPLQRVIVSATLTRNPRKLATLGLRRPKFLYLGRGDHPEVNGDQCDEDLEEECYSLPDTLSQHYLECDSGEKPLVLIELLQTFGSQQSIIFTSSVNATHRLCRLVQLYYAMNDDDSTSQSSIVQEYSSALSQKQRSMLIEKFRQQEIHVLVCSDAVARGVDLPHVAQVINYDVPSHLNTYVHRVGRTARAGKAGTCVTLVKKGQKKQFMRMLTNTSASAKLKQMKRNAVSSSVPQESEQHMDRYRRSLGALKSVLEQETRGTLSTFADIASMCVRPNESKTEDVNSIMSSSSDEER